MTSINRLHRGEGPGFLCRKGIDVVNIAERHPNNIGVECLDGLAEPVAGSLFGEEIELLHPVPPGGESRGNHGHSQGIYRIGLGHGVGGDEEYPAHLFVP